MIEVRCSVILFMAIWGILGNMLFLRRISCSLRIKDRVGRGIRATLMSDPDWLMIFCRNHRLFKVVKCNILLWEWIDNFIRLFFRRNKNTLIFLRISIRNRQLFCLFGAPKNRQFHQKIIFSLKFLIIFILQNALKRVIAFFEKTIHYQISLINILVFGHIVNYSLLSSKIALFLDITLIFKRVIIHSISYLFYCWCISYFSVLLYHWLFYFLEGISCFGVCEVWWWCYWVRARVF